MAWRDAISEGREFDERLDANRFDGAFRILARTRRSWPAPIDFIDALPPRDQLALARESRKADPGRAAAACAEIARELRMDGKTAAAGPDAA